MLKLAGVKEGDVVYDLGCGDGRIVITAVKDFKAKGASASTSTPSGSRSRSKTASEAKVEDKVEFREGDVLKINDVSEATVVCAVPVPRGERALAPMLREDTQARLAIVSHDFQMGDDWKPDKDVTRHGRRRGADEHSLWTIRGQ